MSNQEKQQTALLLQGGFFDSIFNYQRHLLKIESRGQPINPLHASLGQKETSH
jgi:hypothetical protein